MYPIHFPGKGLPCAVRASLLACLMTGAACAAEDAAPVWKLSGFGTLGAVHSSERQADYSSSVLKADGAARLQRLQRLQQQRADLAGCLERLLREAEIGRAWFKVYRQYKMYNDPSLNPYLYGQVRGSGRAAP